MLVIWLREGESFVVGPDVRVAVSEVRGQRQGQGFVVKVAVDAPKSMGIVRCELMEKRNERDQTNAR
jgi:carbon storage regulator CsrA